MGDKSRTFMGKDAVKDYEEYLKQHPKFPSRDEAKESLSSIVEEYRSGKTRGCWQMILVEGQPHMVRYPLFEKLLVLCRYLGVKPPEAPSEFVVCEAGEAIPAATAETLVQLTATAYVWWPAYEFLVTRPDVLQQLADKHLASERVVPIGVAKAGRSQKEHHELAMQLAQRITERAPGDRGLVRSYHEAIIRSLDEES